MAFECAGTGKMIINQYQSWDLGVFLIFSGTQPRPSETKQQSCPLKSLLAGTCQPAKGFMGPKEETWSSYLWPDKKVPGRAKEQKTESA
jgi:hypothetical protein